MKAGGGPPVREAALILIFFSEGPTGWMVLVSSNVGCTEFLHALPGGFMLWKIKCPSNQEETGAVPTPFSPLLFEKLMKRAFCFLFKGSYTKIHLCGIRGLHLCYS